MKIALIGPGIMPIPTDGWGAVETIIYEYYLRLKTLGHDVVVFNDPDLTHVCNQINSEKWDFIHSQYDNHVGYLNQHLKQPFATTSHYGFLKERNLWDGGYHGIFEATLHSPGIVALSDEIAQIYREAGYTGPITTLRNGASVKSFEYTQSPDKECLCLGKIEPRKRQYDIVKMVDGYFSADFVGPIVDNRFQMGSTCNYAGTWTRDELYSNLTRYKVLILASMGEAAPLVVPEAQAAGLNIVCTETSTANLDESTPGVFVLDNNFGNDIVTAIQMALQKNPIEREKIRNYAKNRWDWDTIVGEYVDRVVPFFQDSWR